MPHAARFGCIAPGIPLFPKIQTNYFRSNTCVGARMEIYCTVSRLIVWGAMECHWVRQPPTTTAVLLVDRNAEPALLRGNPKTNLELGIALTKNLLALP